jgi:phage shock protein PspC (stress-responsive transcriptional regulator)
MQVNRRRLYRCYHDRTIAGVSSGLAEYLDIDVTLIRILWIVSIFFGGLGLLLYVIMALVVPMEPDERYASAPTPTVPGTAVDPATGQPVPGATGPVEPTAWHQPALAGHRHERGGREARERLRADVPRDRPRPRWQPGLLDTSSRPGVTVGSGGRRSFSGSACPHRHGHAAAPEPAVIGPAALLVGLLLILTWALGPRVPGEATFASPGSLVPPVDAATGATGPGRLRNPIRAFLLSPIHPATWAATAAILAGFFIELLAFSIAAALFSSGARRCSS